MQTVGEAGTVAKTKVKKSKHKGCGAVMPKRRKTTKYT
jgi:hypothetical protein